MEPTTPYILSLIVPTGILSALLTHGLGWLKDWLMARANRKRDANSAAIKLAIHLEEFAFNCANHLIESEVAKNSNAKDHSNLGGVPPELKPYPEVNWEVLSPTHTSLVLSFPNEIKAANLFMKIRKDVERVELNEDKPHINSLVCGHNGYKAIILAERLREDYKLRPLSTFDTMSHIRNILEAAHTRYVTQTLKAYGIDDPNVLNFAKQFI